MTRGIDSPVNKLSSTVVEPSKTTPSTGIISPGLTLNKSPIATSLIGTSRCSPPLSTIKVLGILLFIDSDSFTDSSITLSSIALPIKINETMKAPVSRNILLFVIDKSEPRTVLGNNEIISALKLPIEIRVSILKSKNLIFLKAEI